jgi:hypothetical protein
MPNWLFVDWTRNGRTPQRDACCVPDSANVGRHFRSSHLTRTRRELMSLFAEFF